MNKRRKYILALVLLLIVVVLIYFFFFRKKDGELPVPTPQTTTSPVPFVPGGDKQFNPSIYPSSGTLAYGGTTNALSLFFNEEINVNSGTIVSDPSLTFRRASLPDFPNRLILQPTEPWETGTTYTITISGVKSIDNQKTMDNIQLKYTITEPELPNVDGEV